MTDARLELVIVADASASAEGVVRTLRERGGDDHALLVSTSAALLAAVAAAGARPSSAIAPDLDAAADLVARRGPVLLSLRLADPRPFVESLALAERRAA